MASGILAQAEGDDTNTSVYTVPASTLAVVNVNVLNKDGINALHIILDTDLPELTKLSIIKFLLNKGIIIENKNKLGDTALSIAAKNNYKNIIIELIKAGANFIFNFSKYFFSN